MVGGEGSRCRGGTKLPAPTVGWGVDSRTVSTQVSSSHQRGRRACLQGRGNEDCAAGVWSTFESAGHLPSWAGRSCRASPRNCPLPPAHHPGARLAPPCRALSQNHRTWAPLGLHLRCHGGRSQALLADRAAGPADLVCRARSSSWMHGHSPPALSPRPGPLAAAPGRTLSLTEHLRSAAFLSGGACSFLSCSLHPLPLRPPSSPWESRSLIFKPRKGCSAGLPGMGYPAHPGPCRGLGPWPRLLQALFPPRWDGRFHGTPRNTDVAP